ncbi:MAG: hypothetical protein P1V36_10385 [Planctomycetota bacterium]|nr:hypothetical protein [Planctomycetota bacterium]
MTRGAILCMPVLLLWGSLLAGCGSKPPAPTLEEHLAKGQAAFARGDAIVLEARAASLAEEAADLYAMAVEAWAEAAEAYSDAFRLIDPVPESASQRAMLAFRVARAFAKAARHGQAASWAGFRADHAFLWLDQTARLAPHMRQVHYERARLFDSDIDKVRDVMAAHVSYSRYLADVDLSSQTVSEAEQPRVALARERRAALAPPKVEGDK